MLKLYPDNQNIITVIIMLSTVLQCFIVIVAPAHYMSLRGDTLGFFACILTRIKKICGKSKKCVCSGRSILDLTKLGAHGGLG